MSEILLKIQAEMERQKQIHPIRPRIAYHWNSVLTEEVLEALLEVTRLSQEHADWATLVDVRPTVARALKTELIQVAAVAASWAETLPDS